MARARAVVTSYIAGDPVHLGPEVETLSDLLRAFGLEGAGHTAALLVAPDVGLVQVLGAGREVTLRWVHLARARPLVPQGTPVDLVAVMAVPMRDCGCAARLVARLRAHLRDAGLVARLRAATTRAELVEVVAPVEHYAGESPLTSEDLLRLLGSSPQGLTPSEAGRRGITCGPNRLERVRRRALGMRLLEQFWSLFAVLLWVAAACAFIAGLAQLGWAIIVVILVNGTFSFLQEYRAERAVEALERLLPHTITVRRGERDARVEVLDLVPGDVVCLEEGDQVPADGQLLEAAGLRVDESALTGESRAVLKGPVLGNERERVPHQERSEIVFAGTAVVAGTGIAVVTATGMATEIGAIAELTQAVSEEPSPLQREMGRLTRIVTGLAVVFGASFFLLALVSGKLGVAEGFVFALGVIVANVPEGLLPTLTLALALGVQRMARKRSLVRRLSAVETLGGTTVICTDKTGTLTENRMEARRIWADGRTWAVGEESAPSARELFEPAVLASLATTDHGDPTEVGIVRAAVAAGVDENACRGRAPLIGSYPFDSYRKRMTLVRAGPAGPIAYSKGAPREMLALCTTVCWNGDARPLTDDVRRAALAEHDALAREGLRLLAVARRPLGEPLLGAAASAVEKDLTFLGFIALWDPPRPEVEAAVALCRRAGIRVVIITGDYGLTAQAIARQIGLPVEKVVSGDEVERLPPEVIERLAAEPGVLFARTSPTHKLAIVTALKRRGEVVAVTGDGVNDAPALKASDVGVAMGRRGSEVAKEAAAMVITDDNFASVVAAVREGRATYANIGKFVTYIFASNVPELVPFLVSVFLGIPLPLTVMQILAVDLGTDLLPALALGGESPEPGVMDRPPRARSQRLLSAGRLLHAYGFLGMIEAGLALLAFVWTYYVAGWRPGAPMAAGGELYQRATTMTLAGIVAAQVGNVFACRTDRESLLRVGASTNRLVLLGVVAEVAILLALILVPPLRTTFALAPLGVLEWSPLLGFPFVVLGCEEVRKWAIRRSGGVNGAGVPGALLADSSWPSLAEGRAMSFNSPERSCSVRRRGAASPVARAARRPM
jgi:calcium-translocating P-type ATPase